MAVMVSSIQLNPSHDTRDVHLLKGFSYNLGSRLVLLQTGAPAAFATLPANTVTLSISFTSNFKGTIAGDEITGNGIKLNTRTGIVSALGGAVAHPRSNFIIKIEADGTSVTGGPHRIYV